MFFHFLCYTFQTESHKYILFTLSCGKRMQRITGENEWVKIRWNGLFRYRECIKHWISFWSRMHFITWKLLKKIHCWFGIITRWQRMKARKKIHNVIISSFYFVCDANTKYSKIEPVYCNRCSVLYTALRHQHIQRILCFSGFLFVVVAVFVESVSFFVCI